MSVFSGTRHARLKIFLYGLGALAVCAMLAVFVGYRFFASRPAAVLPLIDDAANLSIGRVHQTSTRNGIAQWSMDAASAHFFKDRGKTVFEAPEITFYARNDDKIYLTADQGILDMDTRDIHAADNVIIRHAGCVMKTAALHYNHKMRIIFSNDSVDISGKSIRLTANAMVLHMDTGKVDFTGQIEGDLIGDFTF